MMHASLPTGGRWEVCVQGRCGEDRQPSACMIDAYFLFGVHVVVGDRCRRPSVRWSEFGCSRICNMNFPDSDVFGRFLEALVMSGSELHVAMSGAGTAKGDGD